MKNNRLFEVESTPGTIKDKLDDFSAWAINEGDTVEMTYTTPGGLVTEKFICLGNGKLEKIKKPKRSKWHRVEDELPEYDHTVLCKVSGWAKYMTAFYNERGWISYPMVLNENGIGKITHWRELPKPPKEDK